MLEDPVLSEVIWTMEHPSVVTTGRRVPRGLPSARALRRLGTELVSTERGGLATWHGPGQIVAYVLLRLRSRGLSVPAFIEGLEEGMASFLRGRGVEAERVPARPGLWVEGAKIASVGVHVRKGVTLHGCALNLTCDLEPFDWFPPCGLQNGRVTSVLQLQGIAIDPAQAAPALQEALLWSLYQATS